MLVIEMCPDLDQIIYLLVQVGMLLFLHMIILTASLEAGVILPPSRLKSECSHVHM
jgi:hypothetical protein